MKNSEWRRQIDDVAREHDALVIEDGKHLRIQHSDGWRVIVARTPSDWRAIANVRRDIRRAMTTPPRHGRAA